MELEPVKGKLGRNLNRVTVESPVEAYVLSQTGSYLFFRVASKATRMALGRGGRSFESQLPVSVNVSYKALERVSGQLHKRVVEGDPQTMIGSIDEVKEDVTAFEMMGQIDEYLGAKK